MQDHAEDELWVAAGPVGVRVRSDGQRGAVAELPVAAALVMPVRACLKGSPLTGVGARPGGHAGRVDGGVSAPVSHQPFGEGGAHRSGDQAVGEFLQAPQRRLTRRTVPERGDLATIGSGEPASTLVWRRVQQPDHAAPGPVEAVVQGVYCILVLDVTGGDGQFGAQLFAGAETDDLEGVVQVGAGLLVAGAHQPKQDQTDGIAARAGQRREQFLDGIRYAAAVQHPVQFLDFAVGQLGRFL